MTLHYQRFGENLSDFLVELAQELGLPNDKDHAYHVLRTFFHVLRKRLSTAQSFGFIDLLPLPLKAVYVDGWHILRQAESLVELDDFEAEMLTEYGAGAGRDFLPRDKIIIAVKDLFRVLSQWLGEYEKTALYSELPDAVRPLWEETVLV